MKRLICIISALVILLTSCAKDTNIVASVNGEKVTDGEFLFYLESVKSQMAGTELSSDEDWQTKEIEGRKAIDLAKERALDTAVTNLSYIEVGKALGLKLTADEKNQAKDDKEAFCAQFASDKEYKEYLKENGITDAFIDMLCESAVYSNKLVLKVMEESPVADEEITQYFNENKDDFSAEFRRAKHILILTKDMETNVPYTEEKKLLAKEKAEGIYKRALAGEDFDALAREFSEDPGLETSPDGYVFTDGEMVEEFEKGTDALGIGAIGFAESDFGYHIILRLDLVEKDFADMIKSHLVYERLGAQMEVWETEYNIVIETNEDVISGIN